jgi:drug/metabolite transporter (DMT)-like permease
MIAPASWALYTLLSRPLAQNHPAVGAVGVCLIAGAVFLIPLLPHSLHAAAHLSAGGWAWLMFLALGGSAFPYLLWAYSLRTLPVARTAAFMYLVPVFALGWTALILAVRAGARRGRDRARRRLAHPVRARRVTKRLIG